MKSRLGTFKNGVDFYKEDRLKQLKFPSYCVKFFEIGTVLTSFQFVSYCVKIIEIGTVLSSFQFVSIELKVGFFYKTKSFKWRFKWHDFYGYFSVDFHFNVRFVFIICKSFQLHCF